MTTIELGSTASAVTAAGSLIAARAYHDSHLDDLEAKHRAELAAHHSNGPSDSLEDIQARVAEVIAATRAVALRGTR